jgi:hypothetical protein
LVGLIGLGATVVRPVGGRCPSASARWRRCVAIVGRWAFGSELLELFLLVLGKDSEDPLLDLFLQPGQLFVLIFGKSQLASDVGRHDLAGLPWRGTTVGRRAGTPDGRPAISRLAILRRLRQDPLASQREQANNSDNQPQAFHDQLSSR